MKDVLYPLRKLHGLIHEWRTCVLPIYLERVLKQKKVFLIFTPEYGNLGDHAIAKSEKNLLDELNISYTEITGVQLKSIQGVGALRVFNGATILITGGGFLGTLWFSAELLVRDIIKNNPRSKILLFPNTIYYEEGDWGANELQKSIEAYNGHKNLRIYARERISYELMSGLYNNVRLAPDMVLRLNECRNDRKRDGCVLCLRSDIEKTLAEDNRKCIEEQVHRLFKERVLYQDMVMPYNISIDQREAELEKQFDKFRRAELVVTDRLHGMIFSAITGTPCIVVNSKSPKVRGCYEWIKDLGYVHFCEDVSKIAELYRSIPKKEWKYDNSRLGPLYDQLCKELKEIT